MDCLTETTAWEVDWASKWYQGVGQALHYAGQTGKRPGLCLIVDGSEKEARYVERARKVLRDTCVHGVVVTVAR